MVKKRFTGGVTDKGYRVGEWHHRAKLTDREVEEIRDLYESGQFSQAELGRLYGVHKGTIQPIVEYRTRCTTPSRYRDYFKDDPER